MNPQNNSAEAYQSYRQIEIDTAEPMQLVLLLYDGALKKLDLAKKDRGSYYHDMAIASAEKSCHKDDVPADKLKVETYKWAASISDREQYGAKSSDSAGPTQVNIIIDTGIDRREEKEVKCKSKPKE